MTQRFQAPTQPYTREADARLLPVHVWVATDKGQQRESNEDAIYPEKSPIFYDPSPVTLADKGRMLAVADGMGGVRAGAEASRWAIRIAVERYYDNTSSDIRLNLQSAVEAANASLYQYLQDTNAAGAGCTMAVAVIHKDSLYVANVGDSRIYLIRGREIGQISRDHSVVQQKLDQGLIAPEEVKYDPTRNLIYRSLGTKPKVEVDAFPPIQLMIGDCVLICTDGLSDMLTAQEILDIVKQKPNRIVKRLISAANKRGGKDNISILVAYIGNPILREANKHSVVHSTNPLSVKRKQALVKKHKKAVMLKFIRIIILLACIIAVLYWVLVHNGVLERVLPTIISGG